MTKKVGSKKTNKKNHTSQRGITLIALVITIIVMLILVAVTVTIAINGGLFGMAKDAKADTEEELSKENTLSTGRVKIDGTWYDSMEDYVNGTPSKNQSDDSTGGGSGTGHGGTYDAIPKNEGSGTLTDNATWEDEGGKAVIPKGFKVVDGKDGDQSIAKGLVIEDAEGNQFVWIPVTYEATGEAGDHGLDKGFLEVFYRSKWSNNTRTTGLSSDYTEPLSEEEGGYDGEEEEYYNMMKSVQDNGGFYIGRYEAGSTEPRTETSGDTTMVVKRDQYPYNYVGWGSSMNDIESQIRSSGHGAVYLSKHMYEENDKVGVVSTLCYGVQWDAMLEFIKDGTHNVSDSTDWGNHENNAWTINRAEAKYYSSGKWNSISEEEGQQKSKDSSTEILLTTGASDSFSAKNIYDVAGNCYEWTMEANFVGSEYSPVRRGGYYRWDGSYIPASYRNTYSPFSAGSYDSFRSALYIEN